MDGGGKEGERILKKMKVKLSVTALSISSIILLLSETETYVVLNVVLNVVCH